MTGPATFARDADIAGQARTLLDQGADIASAVEDGQRDDDRTWIATDPHGVEWRGQTRRHRPDHSEAA